MVMRAKALVLGLVQCEHPEDERTTVQYLESPGFDYEYCGACGSIQDGTAGINRQWHRPAMVLAAAAEGVDAEPEPPKEEASTRKVGAFELTPNTDGTITVVVQRDDGAKAWRFLSAEAAARLAYELLTAAGASTEGAPTPDAFARYSAGRPEPESPAPLRGIVSEAMGLCMRQLVDLGMARAVLAMLVEATPGEETMQAAIGMARRVGTAIDADLAAMDKAAGFEVPEGSLAP